MQSPLEDHSPQREKPRPWPGPTLSRVASARQEATLLGPVERQIEFDEARRSEFDGLPALQDRLDQLGAQKGEVDGPPDIATSDAVTLGQFPQRSGASGGFVAKYMGDGVLVYFGYPRAHENDAEHAVRAGLDCI